MTTFTDSHGANPIPGSEPQENQSGFRTREEWARVVRLDPCSYCSSAGGTVDHIVPRSKRKEKFSTWLDYTGACSKCNARKAAKPLLLFLLRRPPLTREFRGALT